VCPPGNNGFADDVNECQTNASERLDQVGDRDPYGDITHADNLEE
jgi:hypothetical protein